MLERAVGITSVVTFGLILWVICRMQRTLRELGGGGTAPDMNL